MESGDSVVGFFILFGLLFIGLKLFGIITWAWWLVLLPLYTPLIGALLFLVAACFLITSIKKNGKD